MPATQKWRPSLSTDEMITLIHALKTHQNPRPFLGLIKYFETFALKIRYGINEPAYTTAESWAEKMDLDDIPKPKKKTPEELRKEAFEKWSKTPTACNAEELNLVQTYRAENDLMSESEFEEFMNELMPKS